MARLTKMKIKSGGGAHEVLCLVKHPMETGLRTDKKTGDKIPEHFITEMTFSLNGDPVAVANLGPGVSANPLIGISLPQAKSGDKVSVAWVDNQGESGGTEETVK